MLNTRLVLAASVTLPLIGILISFLSYLTAPLSDSPSSAPLAGNPLSTRAPADEMSSSIRRAAPLVFPAVSRHTATVIFTHGLGDSGHGWADAVERWQRRQRLDEVKFILPHAPNIPITMNFGMSMPGWFDIKSLDKSEGEEDAAGILQSRDYLQSLIQEEVSAGIPADRIVLGGFSQGGAMSIFAGLTGPVKIAGIVGLSSWLLLNQKFRDYVPEGDVNKATPILMQHGTADPLVKYDLAEASSEALKGMGYDVTLRTYRGMQHSTCLEALDEVEAFLRSKLPPKGA